MKIEISQTIEASPADVYAVIANLGDFLETVDDNVVRVDCERQGEVPNGVGTVWVEILELPGLSVRAELETTVAEPGSELAFRFQSAQMRGDVHFRLHVHGDATRVELAVNARLIGFARLLYPVIAIEFPWRERMRLRNLKARIEDGTLSDDSRGRLIAPSPSAL